MYLSEEKVKKLLEITESVDKEFRSQEQFYKRFIAINSLKHSKKINIQEIKLLMKFIKQNTGLFSPFRNNVFILSSLLSMSRKKPEDAFMRMIDHLNLLKSNGFKKSQYLPMTSYTIETLMFDDNIQDMAIQTESYRVSLLNKAKKIYDEMKLNHPWLTGGEDYPLAILIAHSDKDIDRIESIYSKLYEGGLKKGNNLQSMANIASLSDIEEVIITERVLEIVEFCKNEGFKVNQTMYSGIALLAIVSEQKEHIEHVIETTNILKKTKKYRLIDKNLLFMFAVNLVSEDIKKELSTKTITETTLSITIEQLIMAQTAIMIGAIAASTAATTATIT